MKGRPASPTRHTGLKPLPVDRVANLPAFRLPSAPPAPDDLPAEVVPVWDALASELAVLRTWHDSDETLLRRCVVAAFRALQAEQLVETHGVLVKGLHGPIVNPALKVERDSTATYIRLAESLGLSPTSRMRLGLQRMTGMSALATLQAEVAAVTAARRDSADTDNDDEYVDVPNECGDEYAGLTFD